MVPRRTTRSSGAPSPIPTTTSTAADADAADAAAAATSATTASPKAVLYKSSALAATAPGLAFRRRPSARIAAAAATADACREAFKAAQLAKAGCAAEDDVGISEETRNANKYLRRLLLNRHSASASRLRKEAYTAGLERELADLEVQYEELKKKVENGGGVVKDDVEENVAAGGGELPSGPVRVGAPVGGAEEARPGNGAPALNGPMAYDEPTFDVSTVPDLDFSSFLGC